MSHKPEKNDKWNILEKCCQLESNEKKSNDQGNSNFIQRNGISIAEEKEYRKLSNLCSAYQRDIKAASITNCFHTWPLVRGKISIKSKELAQDITLKLYGTQLKTDSISLDKGINNIIVSNALNNSETLKYSNMDTLTSNHNIRHLSMDHMLDNLPLVYNPSTKQLQIVRLNKGTKKNVVLQTSFKQSNGVEHHAVNTKINEEEEEVSLLRDDVFEETLSSPIKSKHKDNCSVSSESCKQSISSNTGSNIVRRSSTRNSFTDGSSFSSSATDVSSVSTTDSAICLKSEDNLLNKYTALTKKKKGFSDFFSRNLFSWKHKDGKVNGLSCDKDSVSLSSENSFSTCENSNTASWNLFNRGDGEKTTAEDLEAGSAGLIMGCRPRNLPAKTANEQERHKQEYESIISAAKKREIKEAKDKKKAQAAQIKLEKQLNDAVKAWNTVILPKWNTMRHQKKCLDLWWCGLPSCVRGTIWKLAIANDLNINPHLYNILVQRSIEKLVSIKEMESLDSRNSTSQESTLNLISLDVSRTFSQLCIFQKGGPFHDPLHNILGAYACYRPDVGYVQGMSFLAATLLLNMDETEAFISFANLLNRPVHMAFFSFDQPIMEAYYRVFEELLMDNLPLLNNHLIKLTVSPDMYFLDWILTVFARSLPLDVTARMWDVYLRDGEEFLFKGALGILKHYEQELIALECTAMTAQYLVRLPEDLCCDSLFKTISSVHTAVDKRLFKDILAKHIHNSTKETPVLVDAFASSN